MNNARKAAGLIALAASCLLIVYILFSVISEQVQVNHLHRFKAAALSLPVTAPRPVSGNLRGLNLNTATREQLMTLPGISKSLADAIIAQRSIRSFSFMEDLKIIKGIGDKRVEALREVAYVGEVEGEIE